MTKHLQHSWLIILLFIVIGLLTAMQVKHEKEELIAHLVQIEEKLNTIKTIDTSTSPTTLYASENLKLQACLLPLEGTGLIIKMDDSNKEAKVGENPNLYIIHDDDLLRVINELRAAGAEALSINGQRLIDTSEIRCAGPTLSVNNVRSSAPYEIHAIGDKDTLENAIKMRGGVAETLKVWGIHLEVESSDNVYIPPYKGSKSYSYAHITDER